MKKTILVVILLSLLCLYGVSATNISMQPDSWSVSKAQRSEVLQHQFVLTNTGNITTTYTLAVTGDISSWGYISPNMIELLASQSTMVNLALIIPSAAEYTTHTGVFRITATNFTRDFDLSITMDKFTYSQNQTFSVTQELLINPTGYSLRLKSIASTVYADLFYNNIFVSPLIFDLNTEHFAGDDLKIKLIDRYSLYAKFTISSVNAINPQIKEIQTIQNNTEDCELAAWTSTYPKPLVIGSSVKDRVMFENTCDKPIKIRKAWFLDTTQTEWGERPIMLCGAIPAKVEAKDTMYVPFLIETETGVSPGVYTPTMEIDYELDNKMMKTFVYFTISVSRKIQETGQTENNTQDLRCPDDVLLNSKFQIDYQNIKANQQVFMEEPSPAERAEKVFGRGEYEGNNWIWEGHITETGEYTLSFILRENGGFVEKRRCKFNVVNEHIGQSQVVYNLTIQHILPANHEEGALEFIVKLPNGAPVPTAVFTTDEMTLADPPSLVKTHTTGYISKDKINFGRKYCTSAYVPGYNIIKQCAIVGFRNIKADIEPEIINLGDTVKITLTDSIGNILTGVTFDISGTAMIGNPIEFTAGTSKQYSLTATVPEYQPWSYQFTPKSPTLPTPSTNTTIITLVSITPNATVNKAFNFTFSSETPYVVRDDEGYIRSSGNSITGSFIPPQIGNYSIFAKGSLLKTIPVFEAESDGFNFGGFWKWVIVIALIVIIIVIIQKRGAKGGGGKIGFPQSQGQGPLKPVSFDD